MNIKREAYDAIISHLRKEVGSVEDKIRKNRSTFRELEHQQTILKRIKAELIHLINVVEGDKPGGSR